MALNAVVSILGSVLTKNKIDNQLEIIEDFIQAMNDTGMRIEEWREAYYNLKLPRKMTGTTMAIQLKNLETEVLMLRNESWSKGESKNDRLFKSFDVGKKDGYTVLIPKTRTAEVVLKNSTMDIKLNPFPSDVVDDLIKKNSQLELELKHTKDMLDGELGYQNELLEEKGKVIAMLQQDLELERKKNEIIKEEHKDVIDAINRHHTEEKSIYTREIATLHSTTNQLSLSLTMLNSQFDCMSLDHKKDIEVLVNHISDVEKRCSDLAAENNLLKEEHDEHIQLIKGLAMKANLEIDEI